MPNYAEPFRQVGMGLGAGAGAGGTSFLGDVGRKAGGLLEALDYPRQAVYNLGRSGYRALSGEGDWGDVASALPGAAGALAAGGLMATGVGAPLGIALGSAVGGGLQAYGHLQDQHDDTHRFDAATPGDLAKAMGIDPDSTAGGLASFGIGALTDPLTYAGGIGGAAKGGEAAGMYGKRLEGLANWRGPQFPGGAEKITGLVAHPEWNNLATRGVPLSGSSMVGLDQVAAEHLAKFANNPELLKEIEPGAQFVGAGIQKIAVRNPSGGIVTMSYPSDLAVQHGHALADQIPKTRPDVPGAFQAYRSKPIQAEGVSGVPIRVEHSNELFVPGSVDPMLRGTAEHDHMLNYFKNAGDEVSSQLAHAGIDAHDLHAGNLGQNIHGDIGLLDADALKPMSLHDATARGVPYLPSIPRAPDMANPGKIGWVENKLLDALGASQSIRDELAQKALGRAPMQGGFREGRRLTPPPPFQKALMPPTASGPAPVMAPRPPSVQPPSPATPANQEATAVINKIMAAARGR